MSEAIELVRTAFEGWYAPKFAGDCVANMPRRANSEYVSAQQQIAWMAYKKAAKTAEAENAALREQITALRYSLTKVRGHTCYTPECDRELLIGLLKSIERIADESLAKEQR